ncbi:MAG: sugar phosphate isomerase/epimerase [Ruminococcaceae bacterium]|nr:sugar phosphate isomerase/epimerase [Oscillospiraceae bacterium]
MQISAFTNCYAGKDLEEALAAVKELGVNTVELGAGGYAGKRHCDPALLLKDKTAFFRFHETFHTYDMDVNALTVHGNPVHPDAETAKKFDADFRNAVLLAEQLEIDTVVTYAGCPGDPAGAKYPNWVCCSWPEDLRALLDWQWNEVLLPYWQEAAAFAREHGVSRVAIEMRPGFCVYNPETMLRLRREVGNVLGAAVDPSHLIWQGIDPALAIRELAGTIYHVRAKDVKIDKFNTAKNGVLDTKSLDDVADRSWLFRAAGSGSNASDWQDILAALRISGYNRVLSVTHEDGLIGADEGLRRAVAFLRSIGTV